jgi:hypothetical protein
MNYEHNRKVQLTSEEARRWTAGDITVIKDVHLRLHTKRVCAEEEQGSTSVMCGSKLAYIVK